MPYGGDARDRDTLFAEQRLLFPVIISQAWPQGLAQGMGRGPGNGEKYEPVFMGDDHRSEYELRRQPPWSDRSSDQCKQARLSPCP